MARGEAVESNTGRTPASVRKDTRFVTAESIAIATGLGYALAFIYQTGMVSYYGVPPETIRVSPEWVIFIGIALIPSVLGFVTGITAGEWLSRNDKRGRLTARFSLLIVGGLAAVLAGVIGSGAWASILLVTAILLMSLALSDWLDGRREKKPPRAFMTVLLSTLLVFGVISGMTFMGYRAASRQARYLVDDQRSRVLVYSTDNVYVFAGYDRDRHSLESTLTFMSAGDFGSSGLVLVNEQTGALKSAVIGR